MPAPFIRFATATNPPSLDLSAVTSAGGVWNELQGHTGADWALYDNGSPFPRIKKEGGAQLGFDLFNNGGIFPSYGLNSLSTITWTAGDDSQSQGGSRTTCTVVNLAPSQASAGLRFSSIVAVRGQSRRLTFVGKTENGTYQAQASMADGSASATFAITNGQGFTLDYHPGPDTTETTLTLSIQRTASNGTDGYIYTQALYIAIPTDLEMAPASAAYFAYQNIDGGANA